MRIEAVPKIATKNPVGSATKLQLHLSQQTDIPAEVRKKMLDFSEHKLKKIFKMLISPEKKAQVADLIEKYVAGKAAVGWNCGAPIFTEIVNDNK